MLVPGISLAFSVALPFECPRGILLGLDIPLLDFLPMTLHSGELQIPKLLIYLAALFPEVIGATLD